MSGYWQVTVIVEGAIDCEVELVSDEALDAFIDEVKDAATEDGKPTEVYTLWHNHAPLTSEDDASFEDVCIQYATDLRPVFVWNI